MRSPAKRTRARSSASSDDVAPEGAGCCVPRRNPRRPIARGLLAALLAVVIGAGVAGRVQAQQPPSPLDEELLDSLDSDPLDPVDRVSPDTRRPDDSDDEAAGELRRRLQRELGAAADSEDDPPLLRVARQMREVERRLEDRDAGPATQEVQRQIVNDLDKLIEEARKASCSSPSGSSESQPIAGRAPTAPPGSTAGQPSGQPSRRPAAESSQRPQGDDGGPPELDVGQVRTIMKELWGELPEQERQQMIESPPEEFLPKYEVLIENYFRRLSEEKRR